MADGTTLDLEFLYDNIIGRCRRCGLLTHIGLPCNGTELPPITKVVQKAPAYKPPPPLALLLAVAAAAAPQQPKQRSRTTPPGLEAPLPPQAASTESTITPPPLLDLPPPPSLPPSQDPSSSSIVHKKRSVKIVRRDPPPKNSEKRSFDSMDIDESSPTVKKLKPALATSSSNLSVPPFELPDDLTLGNLFYTKQKKKPGRPRGSVNKNKLGVSGGFLKKSPKKKSPKKQATD